MKKISEREAESIYSDLLDSSYSTVKIGNLTFDPSRIVKELDSVAFRCGMLDYFDSENMEVE